jgi:hypothetical protein
VAKHGSAGVAAKQAEAMASGPHKDDLQLRNIAKM